MHTNRILDYINPRNKKDLLKIYSSNKERDKRRNHNKTKEGKWICEELQIFPPQLSFLSDTSKSQVVLNL